MLNFPGTALDMLRTAIHDLDHVLAGGSIENAREEVVRAEGLRRMKSALETEPEPTERSA